MANEIQFILYNLLNCRKVQYVQNLHILAVNAPDMKIDRYAFMNATGFSTLICPAGSGDYYRSVLAENRINAEVEEASVENEDKDLTKIENMEEKKETKK